MQPFFVLNCGNLIQVGKMIKYSGEIAGLLTALFWTSSALAFELAVKRAGTYAVNIIRLFFGFILLSVTALLWRGMPFPSDADFEAWAWLSLSGIIGFVVGDLFLFASFTLVSSRISMLIMTLAPPFAAFFGRIFLGEKLPVTALFGMLLVISGIAVTILGRSQNEKRISLNFSPRGIFYAFIGALGQAGGLVLSKIGMKDYHPLASTQIRVLAGFIGFVFVIFLFKKVKTTMRTFSDSKAMRSISVGSVFGPFLGVTFSLIAVQYTQTGIAATLMSIVPVLILAPAHFIYKQKIGTKEIIGAAVSVLGVVLFFV